MKKYGKKFAAMLLTLVVAYSLVTPAMAAINTSYQSKLNGDLPHDIIEIAKAQEGKTSSEFGLGWYARGWCTYFVDWAGQTAGANFPVGDAFVAKWFVENNAGTFYCFRDANYNGLKSKGTKNLDTNVVRTSCKEFSPKKGDIVCFFSGNGLWAHVGFVAEDYNGSGKLQTIEGNTTGPGASTAVYSKQRTYSSDNTGKDPTWLYIAGIVRPNYSKNENAGKTGANKEITISDGLYTLTPACAPNSRLDIKGKSTSNGANAHIWKAYDDTSQIFSITSEGDGYYLITSDYTGKRLDVTNARTSSGTNVQQWSANNNDAQRWAFEDAGDGYYYIVSKLTSGLCLDVNRGGSADGTNVQVWSKNNTASQKWKLTKATKETKEPPVTKDPDPIVDRISEGLYELAPGCAPDSRLDIKGKSTADKANIHIWQYNGGESQQFNITSAGGGYYTMISEATGKAVDVDDGQGVAGRNVWQYRPNGTDAQKWAFQDAGDGYYYIVPKVNTSLRLDVDNNRSVDGTNVKIWNANQYSAQKWKLIPVEEEPKLVSITVDFNGGDGAGVCWYREVGETYGSLPNTTRDGYSFDGWYTSKRGGSRVSSSTRVDGEDEEITIYAHWTEKKPEVPPASEPPKEPEGHWGDWSEWSEKKATASNTRQVESSRTEDIPAHTEYRYGKWGNPSTKQGHACKNLAQQYYGSVAELTTEWYSTRYSPEKDYKIFCGGKNHTHKGCFHSDGNDVWNRYIVDGVTYFWEESREVEATYKTQYRYRDWVTD